MKKNKIDVIMGFGKIQPGKKVEVTDADVVNGRPLIRYSRRMLRFNAEQLWVNLKRQGWKQVPPQW